MKKISTMPGFRQKFWEPLKDENGNPIMNKGVQQKGWVYLIVHHHPGYMPKK